MYFKLYLRGVSTGGQLRGLWGISSRSLSRGIFGGDITIPPWILAAHLWTAAVTIVHAGPVAGSTTVVVT